VVGGRLLLMLIPPPTHLYEASTPDREDCDAAAHTAGELAYCAIPPAGAVPVLLTQDISGLQKKVAEETPLASEEKTMVPLLR
jgi:hypothetical protein